MANLQISKIMYDVWHVGISEYFKQKNNIEEN